MKSLSIIRHLIIVTFFLFAAYGSTSACPEGVSGLSNPNSTVCAKDANGKLWCTQADSSGHFYLIGGGPPPSTDYSCLAKGLLTFYNVACPENGILVDRSGSGMYGGPWLDVSCKGCVPAPTDMVAWYPLDESGGTKAYELTQQTVGISNPFDFSSPLDGKYFGSPVHLLYSNGWVSNALQFDGTNDYVETAHNQALNFGVGDFSIDAWVKIDHPKDVINAVRVIVEKREQGSKFEYRGYSLFLYGGKLSLQIAGGNYANFVSSLTIPADGKWHFVGVTVQRDAVGTFYVSYGDQGDFTINTATFDPTKVKGSLDNTRPLRIGSLTLAGPTQLFKGGIDEVELFNRSLTALEMESLVTAGRYGKCKPCFLCN